MLLHGEKCMSCSTYRQTLSVLHDRWSKHNSNKLSSSSSHTNNRYLNTPERLAKVTKLRQLVENEITRLKVKICNLVQKSESVDQGLHGNLATVMKTLVIYMRHFQKAVFLDQQLENSRKTDAQKYSWHPLMIKWCLNLKLMSSAPYTMLCDLVALLRRCQKEHSELHKLY